jgi:excisionase family DNA binding protein
MCCTPFLPMLKTDAMNKKEAAEYLGISVRQLQNYARQGRLSVRKGKGKTGDISIFDNEELRQLKDERERERGVIQAAVIREPATSEATETHANGDTLESADVIRAFASQLSRLTPQEFIAQLAAAILRQAEQRQIAPPQTDPEQSEPEHIEQQKKNRDEPPIADLAAKPLLTRAEAQRYTGMSRELLHEAVESGMVKEVKLGRAYRMKRVELDAYIKQL